MALQAIAYASLATSDVSANQLEKLVQGAASLNQMAGVTGVLLFDGDRFLQYIEGPDDGIAVVYSRILNSKTHTEIIELARGRVSGRRMPYWPMHWVLTDKAQFNDAAFGDWTMLVRHDGATRSIPTGLDRLAAVAAPFIA